MCDRGDVRGEEVEAKRVLRMAGLPSRSLLGSWVEGIVVDLGDERVAKVWSRRTRDELERLRAFYDAVHEHRPAALSMPVIVALEEVDNKFITVEERCPEIPCG